MGLLHIRVYAFCLGLLISVGTAHSQESSVNDVTGHVELLGNPAAWRFPDAAWAYVRNVWDLEVFDGRLYLGYGNSNNEGFGSNVGPIEAWYFDASTGSFAYDIVLEEEQIDQYVVIDGDLYVPGHDPTDSPGTGYVHRLHNGAWEHLPITPHVLHVYDVTWYQGRYFAALGVGNFDGRVVGVSDDGQMWRIAQLPSPASEGVYRAWEFFQIAYDLYLSTISQFTLERTEDAAGNVGNRIVALSPAIYRIEVEANGTLSFTNPDVDFFGGWHTPSLGDNYISARVARAVAFGNYTVYLGVETVSDHNWKPFALLAADAALNIRTLDVGEGAVPWDVLVDNTVLYALTARPHSDGRQIVEVRATCDLQTWRSVLQFEARTYSRSFALYNGDFYFGQGTDHEPLVPQSGNILRVQAANFTLGC